MRSPAPAACLALLTSLTVGAGLVALSGCVDDLHEGPPAEGEVAEGEGDAGEGEGDAAEGEGDAAEGEGDAGEGEGDAGEGEGDAGEGEGEGEGDAALTLDEALAALHANPEAALLALSQSNGLPARFDEGTLFVTTGDLRELAGDLNNWTPEPMNDEGTFAWIVEQNVAPAGGYKFTDETTFVSDAFSRAYTYDEFGEMSLTSRRAEGLIGGRERHFAVAGFGLAARTVRVLLPPGDVTHVMYAHDGQNLWDPPLGFLGGSWKIEEALPDHVMVVGIDNTSARVDEYTHVAEPGDGGGRSADYDRLLEQVVRPLVRRWYGEPGPIGVMGSSLGGLVSFDIADKNPGVYDFAASLSGTFGWGSFTDPDTQDTMISRYQAAGHRSTVLYLDSGGTADGCADLDHDGTNDDVDAGDNSCETVQMRDVLQSKGYAPGVDMFYVIQEGAQHNEAAWSTRVGNVLDIFASL